MTFKAFKNTFLDLVSFGRSVKPDGVRVGSSSRPVNNFENNNLTIKNETPFERFEWNHNHIIPQYVSCIRQCFLHYGDVIMDTMASQITSLTIIYSTVYSGADQRKHQSSASLAFVRGIHRGPVNSPHKWPVTRKMFPFDDVIMIRNWEMQFVTGCPSADHPKMQGTFHKPTGLLLGWTHQGRP